MSRKAAILLYYKSMENVAKRIHDEVDHRIQLVEISWNRFPD